MSTKITVYRGDDHTLNLSFTEDGSALDITGYTIFFTVKETTDDATDDTNAVISKTVTSHTDPTGGETQISLSSTDTDQEIKNFKYDIQIKDTGDAITTVVVGVFEVTDDVTKRTS